MRDYSLTHLRDDVLLRDLAALVARDRCTTAALLAHIAEVDTRRLYVPAGYPSMFAYCVDELRLSEDAASKRIQAARAARQFPPLLAALADGRLHLTAVRLLAPHLTPGNADDLLAAATHQSKVSIESILARRFPRPEMLDLVQPLPVAPVLPCVQHAPGHVETMDPQHAPGHVEPAPPSIAARQQEGPERFLLQVTIGRGTHDKLRYAQALLGHAVPSDDAARLLDRALDALIEKCEKRKFAATARPRSPHRAATTKRHVPAHVRRTVWERDQGQCTFTSGTGHRCGARRLLEFDHIDPVARGGQATVERMRLRCRAHNQYEAERVFGAALMNGKRAAARARGSARESLAPTNSDEQTRDVMAGLRALGCRANGARRAADLTASLVGATLEERLRAALKSLRPPGRTVSPPRAMVESSLRETESAALLQSSSP